MDAKDRHVLAAAISPDADILLTDNPRHFPGERMAENGIELMRAGELLLPLAGEHPDKVRTAHEATVRYSHKAEADVLATLEAIIGKDAAEILRGPSRCPATPALPNCDPVRRAEPGCSREVPVGHLRRVGAPTSIWPPSSPNLSVASSPRNDPSRSR